MQELAQKVSDAANQFLDLPEVNGKGLNDAAKKWAVACLDCFTDELLMKGLKISVAIVEFTAELELKQSGDDIVG